MEKPPRTLTGSPIFKLCLTALDHFKYNLYWILGNGKKIRYWDDSILGDHPIGKKVELGQCPLCVSDEENANHLLLHCSFASEV